MAWSFGFLILLGIPFSWGGIITSPSQLTNLTYDYIIIGGGTAGLTLASRLTQDPTKTVLVVEAGNTDAGVPNIQVPFMATTLTPKTQIDWNYTTVGQLQLLNRLFAYPRGRVLGGCSSINYMFHQYGASDDWDRIANATGDSGWQWKNMKQFIAIHEAIVSPADGHDTTGQLNIFAHSTTGVLPASLPGTNQSIDSRVYQTTEQLAEFPYNGDMGGGNEPILGLGFLQSAIGGGVRSSSSTTYLRNATSRPNLTILLNTTAMSLVQTTAVNPLLKAFRSVKITPSLPDAVAPTGNATVAASAITIVTAVKDVVLSAGSINTPKLLLLSGIGSNQDLQILGIPTAINNNAVGKNLADHLALANVYSVTGNSTVDPLLRSATQIQQAITTWQTNKTGMMANTLANNLGFFKLPANSTIFETVPDPAAGPGAPHWEMIFSNFWFNPGVAQPATGNFMSIPTVLVSPVSRGTVRLKSTNVFDHPNIDPQFLTSPFDVFAMRETVLALQRFVAAPAWSNYITGPFGSAFNATSTGNTTSIDAYVQAHATGLFHPTGTASMAAPAAGIQGVVQSNLSVTGTEGLRVIDASVFPFPLSTHPQGAVYILAERGAAILEQSTS